MSVSVDNQSTHLQWSNTPENKATNLNTSRYTYKALDQHEQAKHATISCFVSYAITLIKSIHYQMKYAIYKKFFVTAYTNLLCKDIIKKYVNSSKLSQSPAFSKISSIPPADIPRLFNEGRLSLLQLHFLSQEQRAQINYDEMDNDRLQEVLFPENAIDITSFINRYRNAIPDYFPQDIKDAIQEGDGSELQKIFDNILLSNTILNKLSPQKLASVLVAKLANSPSPLKLLDDPSFASLFTEQVLEHFPLRSIGNDILKKQFCSPCPYEDLLAISLGCETSPATQRLQRLSPRKAAELIQKEGLLRYSPLAPIFLLTDEQLRGLDLTNVDSLSLRDFLECKDVEQTLRDAHQEDTLGLVALMKKKRIENLSPSCFKRMLTSTTLWHTGNLEPLLDYPLTTAQMQEIFGETLHSNERTINGYLGFSNWTYLKKAEVLKCILLNKEDLDLSFGSISSLPQTLQRHLSHVSSLNLSHNRLGQLDCLHLQNLTSLNVSSSRLTRIDNLSLLTNLSHLNLSSNLLETRPALPPYVRNPNLWGNPFTQSPSIPATGSFEQNQIHTINNSEEINSNPNDIAIFQRKLLPNDTLRNLDARRLREENPALFNKLTLWLRLMSGNAGWQTVREFTNPDTAPLFARNVLSIVDLAVREPEFRPILENTMDAATTNCEDKAVYYLNSLLVQSQIFEKRNEPTATILPILQKAFVLYLIENEILPPIIRRDQEAVETALHLQTALVRGLAGETMGHRGCSALRDTQLAQAKVNLRNMLSNTDAFKEYLCSNNPSELSAAYLWQEKLKQEHRETITDRLNNLQERMEALMQDRTVKEDTKIQAMEALEEEFRNVENTLVREKTSEYLLGISAASFEQILR
jgi:hypothetical protein